MENKKCSKCTTVKSIDEFYKPKDSWCKECAKLYNTKTKRKEYEDREFNHRQKDIKNENEAFINKVKNGDTDGIPTAIVNTIKKRYL